MRRPPSRRQAALAIAATLVLNVCSDPPAPEPVVESIQLSVLDTGTTMFFREPITVEATPLGHLGVPLTRTVSWASKSPILDVVATSADGRDARISATGIGAGQIEASSGGFIKSFQVTVLDTVYSVVVTPGSVNLIAGDTISLTATVDGPATALTTVRWDSAGSPLKILSSADSNTIRVQAIATGAVAFTARARADTSKRGSAAITAEQGTLVFVMQPSAVMKGAAIGPAVQVEVQDGAGNRSARAANAITLTAQAGSCTTAAQLAGVFPRLAVNGVATFSDLTMNRVSTGCRLTANADPAALPATSSAFDVTARGCAPIPYTAGADISTVIEASDCAIARSGGTFFAHDYSITVPSSFSTGQQWRVDVSGDFAPSIDAYLWPPASVFRTDSGGEGGTVSQFYLLAPGTYRFTVMSVLPGATGSYTLTSQAVAGNLPTALCSFLVTRNINHQQGSGSRGCPRPFTAIPGAASPSVVYILYLPAGQEITVTMRETNQIIDAYLEIHDVTVTGARTFLTSDNNSGGGRVGRDALIVLQSAPTNRFIEILAGYLGDGEAAGYQVTIR